MIRLRPETPVAAAVRLASRLGCVIVVRGGVAFLKRERRS